MRHSGGESMPSLKNPAATATVPAQKADIDTFCAANAAKKRITFAELRAGVASLAAKSDGEIHQILLDCGYVVG